MEANLKQTIDELCKEHYGSQAEMILRIASNLAPRNIHTGMFSVLVPETVLKPAVSLLSQYSFITADDREPILTVKKSVRIAIRKIEKENKIETLKMAALLPFSNLEYPNCLHHAMSILKEASKYKELIQTISNLPNDIVSDLTKQNRFEEAYLFGDAALKVLRKSIGYIHRETLTLQRTIAKVLGAMSEHREPLKLMLPILENYPTFFTSEEESRKFALKAAEQLYTLEQVDKALLLSQRLSDGENLEVLNEATFNTWQDYVEKLLEFQRFNEALVILRKLLRTAIDVFDSVDNRLTEISTLMAVVTARQNKFRTDLKVFEEVLKRKLLRFEAHHPEILQTETEMACAYSGLGRYDEALKIFMEVENKFQKFLGKFHPSTLKARENIGITLKCQGKYDQSLIIFKYVCDIFKRTFGVGSRETLAAKEKVAAMLSKEIQLNGKIYETEKVHEEIFLQNCELFGHFDPETMISKEALDSIRTLPKVRLETLHSAAKDGNLNNLTELIKMGADINSEDYDGRNPMHYSAQNGSENITKMLLHKGLMYNAADYHNKTPLQLAPSGKLKELLTSVEQLFVNVKKGNHQLVAEQISQTSELINAKDKNGHSALHWAAFNGFEPIVRLLVDAGADIFQVSVKGNTPLHIAASKGHQKVVEILLKAIDLCDLASFINAKTIHRGVTALHTAAEKGFLGIARMLLNYGANYDAKTNSGETPLVLSKDQSVRNVLELIDELFLKVKEGNLNVIDKFRTVESHDLLMVLNTTNSEDHTLLQAAVINELITIAKELVKTKDEIKKFKFKK